MCAAPMITLHVAGKANDIADIPSRSFRHGHRWNCPSNTEFLSRFTSQFKLKQGLRWQLFILSPKIIMRVISELLTGPSEMDGWLRLPTIGRVFGAIGAGTSNQSASTPTSKTKISTPLSNGCPGLLDGCGQATSVAALKSLVLESRQGLGPSARPVNWSEGTTLSTEPPTYT